MTLKTMDEQTLRRYLLGDATDVEQEQVELWLMSDPEGYDLLVAAEDDLVDDFLSKRLSTSDVQLFNNYFLVTEERRQKLEFSRSLQSQIHKPPQPLPKPTPDSFWKSVFALMRRPAFGYAMAAVLPLLIAVNAWFMFRVVDLQRGLSSSNARLTEVVRDRDELMKQLTDKQSADEKLQAQLEALEQTISSLKNPASRETLLAFNLMPGVSRSSSNVQRIAITPTTRVAQASLLLLDDQFDSYAVALLDSENRQVWTRDRLLSKPVADGKAVIATVPTGHLPEGDYSFQLTGVTGSGTRENINRYYFRVVH